MSLGGRYYEMSLTFWAETPEEADAVMDRVTTAYCQGEGTGDDHECKNPSWIASLNLVARDHEHKPKYVEDAPPRGEDAIGV